MQTPEEPPAVRYAEQISRIVHSIGGWLLVLLGSAGLLATAGHALERPDAIHITLLMGLFWGLWFTVGLAVVPRVRERLSDRGEPTEFGVYQRVDERTVHHDTQDQCVRCTDLCHEGLERRFRETVVVAGIETVTRSEDTNRYCPRCALAELGGSIERLPEESGRLRER